MFQNNDLLSKFLNSVKITKLLNIYQVYKHFLYFINMKRQTKVFLRLLICITFTIIALLLIILWIMQRYSDGRQNFRGVAFLGTFRIPNHGQVTASWAVYLKQFENLRVSLGIFKLFHH